jgi:hypothetical protein
MSGPAAGRSNRGQKAQPSDRKASATRAAANGHAHITSAAVAAMLARGSASRISGFSASAFQVGGS